MLLKQVKITILNVKENQRNTCEIIYMWKNTYWGYYKANIFNKFKKVPARNVIESTYLKNQKLPLQEISVKVLKKPDIMHARNLKVKNDPCKTFNI